MNDDHDRVAEWDAAYVLGALSPTDRRIFEDHLAQCPSCRAAVAELAPTVGLLSRVPAERARALEAVPEEPAATVRDGTFARVRRARTRRRTAWILAAAVALVLGGIAVPVSVGLTMPQGSVHALSDLAGTPIEASVRLTDVAWGTRIDLECSYRSGGKDVPEDGWPYALAVVGTDGTATTVSTWRAAPGATTRLSAGTDLALGDIGAVEIRTLDGADVLLRYDAAEE
ncbi:anti-sigma factor family protein [Microbacterium sp. RD1]|uniref:anti-sigma factor family protein n=1 Tax=Microbacterium sp. RD1 TaxID=3457313 RepID=UPI003FA59B23